MELPNSIMDQAPDRSQYRNSTVYKVTLLASLALIPPFLLHLTFSYVINWLLFSFK